MELDPIWATLAEPARRDIVEVLKHGPLRAGQIAHRLHMSPQAMSRHLRMLRRHKLVEEEPDDQDARARVYRLRREPFAELQDWLEEVASFWTGQLGAFKKHAEKRKPK